MLERVRVKSISPEVQMAIEQFLYAEAALLDGREFEKWIEILAEDIKYFMPFRQNRLVQDTDKEIRPESEGGHIIEGKPGLLRRARKLGVSYSWSEYPASRLRHLITNVRVRPSELTGEFHVDSYFHFYKSRGDYQTDHLVGAREDILRSDDNTLGFLLAKRTIYLDQSLIQTSPITTFL